MAEDIPALPNVITIALAADMLGVTRQTVHRMIRTGKLRGWRIEGTVQEPLVVSKEDVAALRESDSGWLRQSRRPVAEVSVL